MGLGFFFIFLFISFVSSFEDVNIHGENHNDAFVIKFDYFLF